MKEIIKEYSENVSKFEIDNVFVKKASYECFVHPRLIDPATMSVEIKEETAFFKIDDQGVLICTIKRFLEGVSLEKDKQKKVLLRIEVEHLVQYTCENLKEINDIYLKVISETNAVYNSFPYYRQFVQETCNRLGIIHPLVLPLMKAYTLKYIVDKYFAPTESKS